MRLTPVEAVLSVCTGAREGVFIYSRTSLRTEIFSSPLEVYLHHQNSRKRISVYVNVLLQQALSSL